MSHVGAWPEDRARLLQHGFMETTVYSGREPTAVARDTWETMQHVADLMCLALSEPIMEISMADWAGGRMVKVKVAVRDWVTGRAQHASCQATPTAGHRVAQPLRAGTESHLSRCAHEPRRP